MPFLANADLFIAAAVRICTNPYFALPAPITAMLCDTSARQSLSMPARFLSSLCQRFSVPCPHVAFLSLAFALRLTSYHFLSITLPCRGSTHTFSDCFHDESALPRSLRVAALNYSASVRITEVSSGVSIDQRFLDSFLRVFLAVSNHPGFYGPRRDPGDLFPFCSRPCHSVDSQERCVSPVIDVFPATYPATVFRRIPFFVIDPVELKSLAVSVLNRPSAERFK